MDETDNGDDLVGIDPDTEASLPGRIDGSILKYSLHYPGFLIVFLGVFIFTQISGLYFASMASSRLSISLGFSIIVLLICIRVYWSHVKAMCYHGDLCAGQVISLRPVKVAVYTDLDTSGNPCPVIKIIRLPNSFLLRMPIKIGDLVACVALYHHHLDEEGRWGDFDPKPVQCLTYDNQQIKRAILRIPNELWQNLDKGIAQIGQKRNHNGLYYIDE